MNIILKQVEIEAAIRQYVSGQGLNLSGKHMSMDFTSGRGDKGVSVELCIEEIQIPGDDQIGDATSATIANVLDFPALVQGNDGEENLVQFQPEKDQAVADPIEAVVEPVNETVEETAKTTSLFGMNG